MLASLDSVAREAAEHTAEIVVVDNASSDGTALEVARLVPAARLVRNEIGRGFAGAANQGIALTTAPAICLMTAGTRLAPGALGTLLRELDSQPRIAAAAPLIHGPGGAVQRHGLFRPRPLTAAIVLLGLADVGPFRAEARRYYGRHAPGPAIDADNLSGACLVLKRTALEEVGPFDAERFFLYCEDADWCLRARDRGWRLRFVPDALATRAKSASSARDSVGMIGQYYRSLRNFYRKHEAPRTNRLLNAAWMSASYAKQGAALVANALRSRKGLRY